jgi:KUP system potassium uptake protein
MRRERETWFLFFAARVQVGDVPAERRRQIDLLANAYGIAVAGDMLVTTLLVTTVAYGLWRWPAVLVFPVAGLFFLLDLTFVSANVHKIPAGGWFPLLVGLVALTLMLVWRKGRRVAFERRDENAIDLATFIAGLDQAGAPERMKGTAVYLMKETDIVPAALALNVKHNRIVHEHVVLLKVTTEHTPRVDERNRVKVTLLPSGFRLVWLMFGFAEKPDVPAALRLHPEALECDPDETSFFLGRETPVPSLRPHLSAWQQQLYAFIDAKCRGGSGLLPNTIGSRR